MIPLIAAGLYGFTGMQNHKERQRRNTREDAADARATELHTARMADIAAAQREREEAYQLKTDLKDAGAMRSVEQGTVIEAQTGAGGVQKGFTKDPEEASRVKAIMDAEADLIGAAPATTQQGIATTGRMSKGHQISTGSAAGPMANMADPNSNDEVSKRMVQAYRKHGQFDKAISMENALMDQQSKRLGLSVEQLKFADMQTNRALESALKSGPTWYEGAAKFATDTKRGGLDGITVSPILSADGKTVTMRATMPDGKVVDAGTYSSGESGMLQFSRQFAALPIEKRMDMMLDQIRTDKEDSRWQQTFDFNKKKEENDQQYKSRVLGFQAAQDRRAAETHKIAMEDAKVPAAVKLQAAALSDEMKSVSAAMNKAMAEGSFDPNSANAKSLIERQAMLGIKYRQLLEPHMPGGKTKPAADPLGLNTPASGAETATQPTVATKTAAAPAPIAPAASMQQVAPTMAPRPPSVLDALNPGRNPSLTAVVQPKAQAIESLAAQLKQEQAAMAAAAKSDPQAAVAQAQRVQSIRDAINKHLEGMNQSQAALVIKAAGI